MKPTGARRAGGPVALLATLALVARALARPWPLAVLGALALFAVALVPALAIPLAWPFLFLVPGWIVVARVAPTLTGAGRLGVAFITSVYLSAHLTNLVATLAGSYGVTAVLVAYAILLALSGALAWRWWRPPWTTSGERLHLPEFPREAFALAGLATLWVGGVLGLSIWHLTPDGWVSGGWNWSDLLVHVSIANSINAGNFPPQVPYFAGVPLTYHWFADFHAAATALIAGADTIPVMAFSSALAAGALVLVTWELAWVLLGNRRAALIAATVMVFTGGMGWLRLPLDWLALPGCPSPTEACRDLGGVLNLIASNPYDNRWYTDWPHFSIPSVMGTGLLTHRATTFGLPGLVAVVLLVQVSLGRRPWGMFLAGLLAAALAPFHFFAFPAVYLIVLLQAIAARAWTMPNWRLDAVRFLAPALLAIPFVLPAFDQVGSVGQIHLTLGWAPEGPIKGGPLAVAFFYLTNLGVPFMLALAAIFLTRAPWGTFLAAWLGAMFLIPNVAVFTAVVFDMNKYFQIMWVAVALLAGWLMRDWRRRQLLAAAIPSVLAPLLVSLWFLWSDWVVLSPSGERAAEWIRTNVPQRVVFVTEANINSPVDLAGRLRIATFWAYAANLGYDPGPREDDVKLIACAGDATAVEVMKRYGATYVLAPLSVTCDKGQPGTDFDQSPWFERVFTEGEVRIWHLVAPAGAVTDRAMGARPI